jgi:hypothetical protein
MAQSASNIHVGPMRIWVGVTNPTSGTPPTLMTHTAGVPATGTEVGYTEGDGVFEYVLSKEEIDAEQALAPVDVFVKDEMVHLTVNLQEANYTALKAAFDSGVGNVDDGSKTLFYSGGNVPTAMTLSVFFSSVRRDAPTKYFIGVIYKAYSPKGFNFAASKTKKSVYPVELRGILDTTRNAGDQLYQFFREK